MTKTMDPRWEEIHANQEWGKYPAEHVIRFIARNYYDKNRTMTKILDYGCGGGAHTWYLAREGFDTYAFDGAPSAIKKVENRMQQENLQAHLIVCDAGTTPYENDFFDAVVDNFCVSQNTTEEIKEIYREIYRILKPGGKLLTAQFGKRTDGYGTGIQIDENTWSGIDNRNLNDVGKIHFADKEEISKILQDIGFVDITIDTLLYTDRGVMLDNLIIYANKHI